MHTRTIANLEKEIGSKAVVEAITGKRPLMYVEYSLCEEAHRNHSFSFKSNLLREIYKNFEILIINHFSL